MQDEILIAAVSEKRRRCLLVVCALLILCLSQAALAQSGRRQSKNPSPTPPAPVEPKTESEVKPPAPKPAPLVTMLVGGDRMGSSFYILPSYVDEAVNACVEELRKRQGWEATGSGNMTRKEAIDRAKKGKDTYVLWLEIGAERDASNNVEVSISYSVYTPQTAKIMTSGRVYLGSDSTGVGGVRVGVPSIGRRLPLDYQMREAGREVADRVLSKFRAEGTD